MCAPRGRCSSHGFAALPCLLRLSSLSPPYFSYFCFRTRIPRKEQLRCLLCSALRCMLPKRRCLGTLVVGSATACSGNFGQPPWPASFLRPAVRLAPPRSGGAPRKSVLFVVNIFCSRTPAQTFIRFMPRRPGERRPMGDGERSGKKRREARYERREGCETEEKIRKRWREA